MKQFSRILGIFLCIFMILSVECMAAHAEIDVSNAANGAVRSFAKETAP